MGFPERDSHLDKIFGARPKLSTRNARPHLIENVLTKKLRRREFTCELWSCVEVAVIQR